MKKTLCIILSAVILMSIFVLPASAESVAVPTTKAEIVADYNRVINELKDNKDESVNIKNVLSMDTKLIDAPDSMETILQKLLEDFAYENTTISNTFKGGISQNGESISAIIPPLDRNAELNENDVSSAAVKKHISGGYDITLTLPHEIYVFDKGAVKDAVVHNKAFRNFDLSDIDVAPVEIDYLSVDFTDTKITASVDSKGRLAYLYIEETNIIEYSAAFEELDEPFRLKLKDNSSEIYKITYDFVCKCNCHKDGIIKFFWSIINFIRNFFGNYTVCDCGIYH